MARSRNIKPGFFTNEELLECTPLARLLFAGLWCLADREGRLHDRPKKIKIEVLPCDNCDVDSLLQNLHDRNLIVRYEVKGEKCIQINSFLKHQKPHTKETPSTIPPPNLPRPRKVPAPPKVVASPADSLSLDSPILIADSSEKATPSIAERFADVWALYPKHNGSRKEAEAAYTIAIKKGAPHEDIIDGVRRYATYIASRPNGAKFTKHAHRWINNHQWESEWAIPRDVVESTWRSEGSRLRAKYAAEADREEQGNAGGAAGEDMRLAEGVWEDAGGAGDAGGRLLLGAGGLHDG